MKMRNVAIALFVAVVTFSTSAVFSQDENTNNDLSVSNNQTTLVGGGGGGVTNDVNGMFVPD